MSFIRETIPTPVYPCGGAGAAAPAERTGSVAVTGANGTIYQYVLAYEAATGKKYKFKSNEERMRYVLEAAAITSCPG